MTVHDLLARKGGDVASLPVTASVLEASRLMNERGIGGLVITDQGRDANFTNEIGYGGTVRLLKNIVGLWLVQECKREWAKQGREYDYATLTKLATDAKPFASLINPADARSSENRRR